METRTLESIRERLQQKRSTLTDWLHATPSSTRQIRLGPAAETDLARHIDALDAAVDQACEGELGVCTVCHEHVESELLEMDYTACVCLSHLSDAERSTLESELELAAAVQKSLLPQELPESTVLQLAAYSRPAQIIGGDYFGFYRFKNGAEGLAIADVAGHGVSASLHMAGVHALLQTLVSTTESPADVLEHVQQLFVRNAGFMTFVTVFLAAYDPDARTLTYCNAGHNPPILVTGQNGAAHVEWLAPTAPAVGLVDGLPFKTSSCPVSPGDVLLMYTDGVTEATDGRGEPYGAERLAEVLQASAGLTAREILQNVRRDLERFVDGAPLQDDTTLVVCKVAG